VQLPAEWRAGSLEMPRRLSAFVLPAFWQYDGRTTPGFLYTARARIARGDFSPTEISSGFPEEINIVFSQDPSPYLSSTTQNS
jgi:hypothetical protein